MQSKILIDSLCCNFLLLCIVSYSQANFAAEEVIAGRVVAVSGTVRAVDGGGDARQLSRRSEIYIGDTIETQPASFAQIRMTDSAIISLKESTRFEIVAYSYEDNVQSDISTMRLIEGGFRTITGSIGRQNRNAYNVETAFATIGIRGTDHEAVIDIALFTGVYDGGTRLDNSGGSLDLGLGADFDFGVAVDPNIGPQGLLLIPAQLGNIPVLNVEEPEEDADDNIDDSADDNADGNADDNADGNADDNANGGVDDVADAGAGAANDGAPALSLADTEKSLGVDTSGATAVAAETNEIQVNPNETSGDGRIDCAVNSSLAACKPEDDALTPVLNDIEINQLQRVGFVITGSGSSRGITTGLLGISNVNLLAVTSTADPRNQSGGEPLFILSRDAASLQNLQTGVAGFSVDWAIWDGSAATPVTKFTDPDDNSARDLLPDPMVVVAVLPTALGNLNGNATYSTDKTDDDTAPFIGITSPSITSSISGVWATISVDLDTGVLSAGALRVCLGGTDKCASQSGGDWEEEWLGSFGGTVVDGVLIPTAITGTRLFGDSSTSSMNGLVSGVFTGSEANAIALGFQLQDSADTDSSITGASLLKQSTVITAEEKLALAAQGFSLLPANDPFVKITSTQLASATGLFHLDVSSEIINDTDIIFFQGAQQLGGANDSTISSIKRFSFDINFDTGSLSNGGLVVTTASGAIWDTQFSGFINGNLLDMTVTGGTITGIDSTTIDPTSSVRGDIAGFFFTSTAFPAFEDSIPEPGRLPDIEEPPDFVGGLVGGFSLRDENSSYTLSGSVLISGKDPEPEPTPTTEWHQPHGPLQPQPPAVETRPPFISWGPWANQVTQNFVAVTSIDADNATISSGDFLANVNPAPISSMTGTLHSYQNGDHASYVGSSSAGSILGVFAHLHVDFDSGAITDGRLDVDVGVTDMHPIQTWSLGFTGSVSGGVASLNSSGGSLSDLGGLVSSSIGATLGGLFTGDSATWFVGGFNLIDMLNDSNSVQGLYVIER